MLLGHPIIIVKLNSFDFKYTQSMHMWHMFSRSIPVTVRMYYKYEVCHILFLQFKKYILSSSNSVGRGYTVNCTLYHQLIFYTVVTDQKKEPVVYTFCCYILVS